MEPLQIVIGCEPALVQRGLCSIMADASDIVVVGEVGAPECVKNCETV